MSAERQHPNAQSHSGVPAAVGLRATLGARGAVWLAAVAAGLALASCGGRDSEESSRAVPPAPQASTAAQPADGARTVTLTDPAGDAVGPAALDMLGASVGVTPDRRMVIRVLLRQNAADRRLRLKLGRRTIDVVQRDGRLTVSGMRGASALVIDGGLEVTAPWSTARPPRSWKAATFAGTAGQPVDELRSSTAGSDDERTTRSGRRTGGAW